MMINCSRRNIYREGERRREAGRGERRRQIGTLGPVLFMTGSRHFSQRAVVDEKVADRVGSTPPQKQSKPNAGSESRTGEFPNPSCGPLKCFLCPHSTFGFCGVLGVSVSVGGKPIHTHDAL
jgi:hypothetical protein